MSKELEKSSIIIFTLSMGANVINYIFQITTSRLLSVSDFGAMNALFSLLMLAALPSSVFALVVSKYTAEFNSDNQSLKIPYFIKKMAMYAGIISIIVSVIIILSAPFIRSFLLIDDPYVVELLAVAAGLGIVSPVFSGGLQGLKKFVNLGLFSIIVAIVKLGLSILLIFLGFSLLGIAGALIIAGIVSIAYGAMVIKKHFSGTKPQRLNVSREIVFRFMLVSLITSICLAVFTNIDMLMVKHFFNETNAGLYSSAMQFGKILLYVPTAFVLAMFPIAAEENARSGNPFSILKKSLLYCAVLTIGGAILFCAFSQFFITFLFGQKYIEAAALILPACLMVIPLGFNTTIMNFSLAINKTKFLTYTMIAGCAINLLLIYFVFHNTISEILYTLTWTGFVMFAANIVYLYCIYKKVKKS
jgi:O-antigen/teichoic acid export membrane protein